MATADKNLNLQATIRKLEVKLARQLLAVAETRAHIDALEQLSKLQPKA